MKKLAGLAVLALAVGCVGEVPPQPDPNDPTPGADAGNDPTPAAITGTVTGYDDGLPIEGAMVQTEGLASELSATTDALGVYTIEDVPADQVFGLMVTGPGLFRITHNPRVLSTGVTQTVNLMAIDEGYIGRSHATNVAPPVDVVLDTAYVLANFVKGDGTPRDALPIADVLAVDQQAVPAPILVGGIHYVGLDGLASTDILTSTPIPSKGNLTTAAFLNVPPGPVTIQATYPADGDGGNGGGNQIKTLLITAVANHAYIVTVNDKPVEDFLAGGGGGGDGSGGGGGDGSGGGGN